MEVIQAKSAGFCFGVARAVKMAQELAKTAERPRMLGSVIHNGHVTAELERQGMRTIENPREARPGDSVLLRAHGVGREVYRLLEEQGARVVDAACPIYDFLNYFGCDDLYEPANYATIGGLILENTRKIPLFHRLFGVGLIPAELLLLDVPDA